MLKVDNVTRRFGTTVAVDGVSLDIAAGQMVGIIGRSGAGKSTLLRMINRLIDPSSGDVYFGDVAVTRLRGADLRRWQSDCAMIFQQFNLVPRLDVITNVMFGKLNSRSTLGTVLNLFSREDIFAAIDILERLGIAEHGAKRAEALSGGQQQRVGIARALMQDPKIILADEPIASLDPMNAQVVMDTLRRIHDEDRRLVICNLHTLDTARRYCDRVIGMRDGKVVFDGSAELLSTRVAREIYGADQDFSEESTSTSIETLSRPRRRPSSASAAIAV